MIAKNFFLPLLAAPIAVFAQIDNTIEGLIVNTPCEIAYTNLQEKDMYACVFTNGENLFGYSIKIVDFTEQFKAANEIDIPAIEEYIFQFVWEENLTVASSLDTILLGNGQKAMLSITDWIDDGVLVRSTSVAFLYQQKWFNIGLFTNNRNDAYSSQLVERIKVR
jgi:hypothetical protein